MITKQITIIVVDTQIKMEGETSRNGKKGGKESEPKWARN